MTGGRAASASRRFFMRNAVEGSCALLAAVQGMACPALGLGAAVLLLRSVQPCQVTGFSGTASQR